MVQSEAVSSDIWEELPRTGTKINEQWEDTLKGLKEGQTRKITVDDVSGKRGAKSSLTRAAHRVGIEVEIRDDRDNDRVFYARKTKDIEPKTYTRKKKGAS